MPSILYLIKECVLSGRVRFTKKARDEMYASGVGEQDVVESIANAPCIHKTMISRRRGRREKLYVLLGFTTRGMLVYTKGKLFRERGEHVLYVLVSSKRSTGG